jgi:hypothetical protein
MRLKIFKIKEKIREKDFPKWIKEEHGYECIRFINKNMEKIKSIVGFIFIFRSTGKPDFFIYKKKEFYFCEFKSYNDGLKIQQIEWFANHKNFPIAIAISGANNYRYEFKDKEEVENERCMKIERSNQRIKTNLNYYYDKLNLLYDLYYILEPKIMLKNMHMHMHKKLHCWTGIISKKLSYIEEEFNLYTYDENIDYNNLEISKEQVEEVLNKYNNLMSIKVVT